MVRRTIRAASRELLLMMTRADLPRCAVARVLLDTRLSQELTVYYGARCYRAQTV